MDGAGGEMTWGKTISSVRVMNGPRGENSCALQFGKTKDWCPGGGVTRYIAPCHVKWLRWSGDGEGEEG